MGPICLRLPTFACVFPLKWHKYDPNMAQDYWIKIWVKRRAPKKAPICLFKKSLTIYARTGARVIGAGGSNAWLAYVVALKHDSVAHDPGSLPHRERCALY